MSIILNDGIADFTSFSEAVKQLSVGADSLSVGVSYVQKGGWELFRQQTNSLRPERIRLVCTDQMSITQPSAVRYALAEGVKVRNYMGDVTYHPKVILAHDSSGRPIRFLIGSANLSYSALVTSVEVGILGADAGDLKKLQVWFDDLFQNKSSDITPEMLGAMEVSWLEAAVRRAQSRLRFRHRTRVSTGAVLPIETEDVDALEDVFAAIQPPIGLLNIDYARNNIRNVSRVRAVLADWNHIANSRDGTHAKQRSELKLLGFSNGASLTALGLAAAGAANDEAVAFRWCRWLQQTTDSVLADINDKLLVAKRVFPQFWRLQQEVRDFFLDNAENPNDNVIRILQVIELLCNSQGVVQSLSLDDIRTLVPLLDQQTRFPPYIQTAIAEYFGNKGTRSWKSLDRRIIPNAWHQAAV